MAPSKIMIIRHGEEPLEGQSFGLRPKFGEDANSLSAHGWQRAGALIQFFARSKDPIAPPNHIYAAKYEDIEGGASRRPRQTVKPLARFLKLTVDDRFGAMEGKKLAEDVKAQTGNVLISWSHSAIPDVVSALGLKTGVPVQWADDRFDLVWLFDLKAKAKRFQQVPQMLLPADRPEVISNR